MVKARESVLRSFMLSLFGSVFSMNQVQQDRAQKAFKVIKLNVSVPYIQAFVRGER